VFDELRRSVQEIAFLSDPTVGELRVGSGAPYIDGILPAVITRLDERYPRVRFRVTETDAVTLCGMLRDRKLDLVVGRVQAPLLGEDLISEDLFDERMHVVAGLDNPWTRRRKVRLSELVTEPWLMPESDNIAMALISEAFRSAGLEVPTPHVISNSMTFRIRLIETGRFIGILPESTLKFAGRRLHAKILPVALSMLSPPTVAISLKNRTPNPISKLFADEIRAAVKEKRTILDRAPP
jgi:DNA-binding transcriptional LysR family regulator